MRHALVLILTLCLFFGAPWANAQTDAQDALPTPPIEAVIAAQIDAFKADDFDRAFTYASPTIQGMFGTPENFGAMVRQGYPMVWHPAEVQFLQAETRDGKLWQDVLIRDAEGRIHILAYQMIEGDQGWKINAVQLRDIPGGMV